MNFLTDACIHTHTHKPVGFTPSNLHGTDVYLIFPFLKAIFGYTFKCLIYQTEQLFMNALYSTALHAAGSAVKF